MADKKLLEENQGYHILLKVSRDFSGAPGPGRKSEGENSGEEFLENVLLQDVKNALKDNTYLLVDLDGTFGYGISFLKESFGRIIEHIDGLTVNRLLDILEFKTEEEPSLEYDIIRYIDGEKFKINDIIDYCFYKKIRIYDIDSKYYIIKDKRGNTRKLYRYLVNKYGKIVKPIA